MIGTNLCNLLHNGRQSLSGHVLVKYKTAKKGQTLATEQNCSTLITYDGYELEVGLEFI